VEYHWKQLARNFLHIEIDEYVTMPNHIHGIIHTVKAMHYEVNNGKRVKEFE